MKTILLNILALVVIIAVAVPMIGGTFATWSDSEIMEGNYIETGSLDLMVAKYGENWLTPGPFRDDKPWGTGVDPCFYIPEVELGKTYSCYLLLWNAGCIDGKAYLHIKNVPKNNSLADTSKVKIWYDVDGKPETPLAQIKSDTIADLDCHEIELGVLQAGHQRQLKLELEIASPSPTTPIPASPLSFDIIFELVQRELLGKRYAWADTEYSRNALNMLIEVGGSTGFWSGKAAVSQYGKPDIVSWFKTIVEESDWYEDDLANGSDDEVYDKMKNILKAGGAKDYGGMVNQFRAQYMATNLNTMTDPPRLQLGTTHDISDIKGAEDYFGYASGTLAKIIAFIEGEADGDIFSKPPTKDEMEIMKDVCEKLNNP